MKRFALLVERLNLTTKTNEKIAALVHYFSDADEADKIWLIALFSGRRPKRTISSTLMRQWCAEYCQLPLWLVEECYHTVGDLSETIALLIETYLSPQVQDAATEYNSLAHYLTAFKKLEEATEEEKKAFMLNGWHTLPSSTEHFVFNKLMSGSFRIGVSQQLMVQALAKVSGKDAAEVAHRLSGAWKPESTSLATLLYSESLAADSSKPYPFYLAYPLEGEIENLGAIEDWQVEWKWDGIRGQIIKRNHELFVWSRGEELMTDRFPEYEKLKNLLPNGLVLDGEIIIAQGATPLPFALMQTRIGRKNITKKIMEQAPVGFFAYDLLEYESEDVRAQPLTKRRALLEKIVAEANEPTLQLSPLVQAQSWEALTVLQQQSRAHFAEGFMLKRKNSVYQTGRKRGDWWKWKIEPYTIDAVMIYAQKGSGRRSNLYTDYTFALKDGDALVPFAKAYSGLTDKEIAQVDAFVKRHAIEKFGPVRTVKPELVFELAFEGIALSKRHKSGVAVRFPRIIRWRHDKKVVDINTLDDLKQLLPPEKGA